MRLSITVTASVTASLTVMVTVMVTVTVTFWMAACGVAPVRRDGSAGAPPTWTYVGHHGRPIAYGGHVCAVAGPHRHEFPPSPREAFLTTNEGLVDSRQTWPFYGNHRHAGRTCFREGWHLHLEPNDAALVWDDEHAAWRAP